MKDKDSIKTMDAEELADSLALMKEEAKNKKRSCKKDQCKAVDKSGKEMNATLVAAANKKRKEKAAAMKAEYEKEKAAKQARGEKVVELVCPKGKDDAGNDVECSDMGHCTYSKKLKKGVCSCNRGFTGRACTDSLAEREERK